LSEAHLKACCPAEAGELIESAGTPVSGKHHEIFLTELSKPNTFLGRQRVFRRQHDKERLLTNDFQFERGISDGRVEQANVDLTVAQRLDLFGGPQGGQFDLNVLKALAEDGEDTRHGFGQSGTHQTNRQLSENAIVGLVRDFNSAFCLRNDVSRLLKKGPTCGGQMHTALCAYKERYTQFLFQMLDLLAQWWLCYVQALRSAGEVQFLRNGDKVAKMA
jgi:hypothetical protein